MDALRAEYFRVMELLTRTFLMAEACHLCKDHELYDQYAAEFYRINAVAESLEIQINTYPNKLN